MTMQHHTSPLFKLQYLATAHFKAWLASLVESREALGSELVEACADGLNTQPADFDLMLRHCEDLGWIARSFFAPSVSAQAFGGLMYHGGVHHASDDAKRIHASWYAWRIVDAEAARSFCGQTKSAKTNYQIGDRVKYAPLFIEQIRGGESMRKARGHVVGFSTLRLDDGTPYPRVAWSDDPKDEPACQAPIEDAPICATSAKTNGVRLAACSCPRVAYTARAVHPKAIRSV
jgi:hypothetical protein